MIVTIHHSASDNLLHDNIQTIRQWHLERGFKDVGYHVFIRSNGSIELGRPIWEKGAHVKGHNSHNIGICLSGNEVIHDVQLKSLANFLKMLKYSRIIAGWEDVFPHNHFKKSTICPGFDVEEFKKNHLYS